MSDIPCLLVCARKSESTEQRGSRFLSCLVFRSKPGTYCPSDFCFIKRFGGYKFLLGLQKPVECSALS